jgi:hypothetical protein
VIVIMMHRRTLLGGGALAVLATLARNTAAAEQTDNPAANDKSGGHGGGQTQPAPNEELSLEEKMRRRYPQPVKAGFLVGLPVLDWNDSTLGFVTNVVRTGEGKIQLIMPYGGWFGRGGRPVALPIETVAILARQIDLLEWGDKEIAAQPTWTGAGAAPIDPNETIRIALTRR